MFGAILKATDSSFQKGMAFCRSLYVTKVITLLAFIFEHPSYNKPIRSTVSNYNKLVTELDIENSIPDS